MTPLETLASNSAEATEAAGLELSSRLRPADVVLLEGDLAAGKTTFVRGLVKGLGGNSDLVSSPTFVLLQSYDCASDDISVVHHESVTDLPCDEILCPRIRCAYELRRGA